MHRALMDQYKDYDHRLKTANPSEISADEMRAIISYMVMIGQNEIELVERIFSHSGWIGHTAQMHALWQDVKQMVSEGVREEAQKAFEKAFFRTVTRTQARSRKRSLSSDL